MSFDDQGRGTALAPAEVLPDLDAFGGSFIWLHFDLQSADVSFLIQQGWIPPRALATAAFGPDEHQRVTVEDGYVAGVVADLARAGAKPDTSGRLHFVMGPRSLVSGRRPRSRARMPRAMAERGEPIPSPVLLLETLVGYVTASMSATGQRLSQDLDAIEDHILDNRTGDDRRRLGPIRRNAVRLHRQLVRLAAVFHRLEADDATQHIHGPAAAVAARIAQRLDALDRYVGLLAERARLLQDEVGAHMAEESNRQLYVLSILSALFLPPMFITGVLGMNVKGLPLSETPNGFLVVLGLSLVSAACAYAVIRSLGIRSPRD